MWSEISLLERRHPERMNKVKSEEKDKEENEKIEKKPEKPQE
jgi:hypothetical protein